MNFNPEITSQTATHFDNVENRKVKVFFSTRAFNFQNNKEMFTAEIMTGKSKGLYTNVYAENITKL